MKGLCDLRGNNFKRKVEKVDDTQSGGKDV